tara:strand:+ start:358 stop:870 length:513 start_codon:yes stop_codon:yes gene_type:complete
MNILYADIEPSFLFLLLWGLLSWLSKQNKSKIKSKDNSLSENSNKKSLFENVLGLNDNFSSDQGMIFENDQMNEVENYLKNDKKINSERTIINKNNLDNSDKNNINQIDITIVDQKGKIESESNSNLTFSSKDSSFIKRKRLYGIINNKNKLRESILLMEILRKPSALKN